MSTWRDKHIVRKIAQFVEKHKGTQVDKAELEKVIADKPPKPRTIAVGDLTQRDVQSMFNLTQVRDSEFKLVDAHPLPPDLESWLEKTDRARGASDGNEATVRIKLNLLLIAAHDLVTSARDQSARGINVQVEPSWTVAVDMPTMGWDYGPFQHDDEHLLLKGRPDYAIWYGEKESIDLNVIVMEAKKTNAGTDGIPQALAYMAMVHVERRRANKTDTTVYGITTDAQSFFFLKIDDNSQWSFRPVGASGNMFEEAFGLIVHLMTKAAMRSPFASKRSSRRTDQSIESMLSFGCDLDVVVEEDD